MSLFEYISVSISIILALGVARLLTSIIDLIRYRKSVTWHWVPLVWALAILILQFQFWWQIFALDSLLDSLDRAWRNVDYLVMVIYTITLFAAGSLILPTRYGSESTLDLLGHFRSEGKLALLALLGYVGCAIPLLWVVLGQPFFSQAMMLQGALALAWAVPILGTFFSQRNSVLGIWTGIFALTGVGVWLLTVIQQH